MGQAKRRAQQKQKTIEDALRATELFNSIDSFPTFTNTPPREKNLRAVKGYHHLMRLIFIRSKHLHASLLDAIYNQDSYTAFVLLKAYFETAVFLCYCYIQCNGFIENHDYKALMNWAERHAMGGKFFPPEEVLQKKGRTRKEFQQDRIGTWLKGVDADFDTTVGEGTKVSELWKMYGEVIAEFGHPTFLGLSICEERHDDNSITPRTDQKHIYNDDSMTFNHLGIVDIYFFHYWDKFQAGIKTQLADAS